MRSKGNLSMVVRGFARCWLALLLAAPGQADDIEIHVPDPARVHLLLVLDVQPGAAARALAAALETLLASPQLEDIQLALAAAGAGGAAPEYRRLGDQRSTLASAIAARLDLDPDPAGEEESAADDTLYHVLRRQYPPQEEGVCAEFQVLTLSSTPLAGGAPLPVADPAALRRSLAERLLGLVSSSRSLVTAIGPPVGADPAGMPRDLYLGMFEARPRIGWRGNLKKLRLVATAAPDVAAGLEDGAAVQAAVVDSQGDEGLERAGPLRGQISARALTFWTDPDALAPAAGAAGPAVAVDGAAVARGGAGQKVPGLDPGAGTVGEVNGFGSRQLFTEAAVGAPLLPLDADLLTAQELAPWLGTEDPARALSLLRWARGWEEGTDPPRSRDWLLGEVLHSRPLAINYGAVGAGYDAANPNVRVLFGSGEGFLHVLENTDSRGRESGREVYGFMPRELLANLRLRRAGTLPASQLRYGVDGSPVALLTDRNGDGNLRAEEGDEALVYFGLRRGGPSYYALDMSDPTLPPRLQWVITRTQGGDFDELGLSFSTPLVGRVKFGGSGRDVLIFGGGYQDRGNAVYIVDARSGELIWKAVQGTTGARSNRHHAHAELGASIAADVAALTDAAGYIHRLYVGDTGGKLWRFDLPPGHGDDPNHRADNWSVTLFAVLGGTGADNRRFFHAAELVQTRTERGQRVDGILISSGDRAHPAAIGVGNFHFYLKDYLSTSGDPAVREREPVRLADLGDQTGCNSDRGMSCADTLTHGWKIALEGLGEKGLARPVLDAGRVFMSSFTPSADPCARTRGLGRLYVMALADGAALAGGGRAFDLGEGIPAEILRVGDYLLLPSGGAEVAGDPDGALLPGPLQRSLTPRLLQVYWRQPGIDRL